MARLLRGGLLFSLLIALTACNLTAAPNTPSVVPTATVTPPPSTPTFTVPPPTSPPATIAPTQPPPSGNSGVPQVQRFDVSPTNASVGDPLTFSWALQDLPHWAIWRMDAGVQLEPPVLSGEGDGSIDYLLPFTPNPAVDFKLCGLNRDGQPLDCRIATVTIIPGVPSIHVPTFTITPLAAAVGQPVTVTWAVDGGETVLIHWSDSSGPIDPPIYQGTDRQGAVTTVVPPTDQTSLGLDLAVLNRRGEHIVGTMGAVQVTGGRSP